MTGRRVGAGATTVVLAVALALAVGGLVGGAPARGAPARACADIPVAPFVDVADTATHARAVDCLAHYEVAAGVGVDAFAPKTPVRREQLATFLARAVAASRAPLPAAPAPSRYVDVGGGVHAVSVHALTQLGIVVEPGQRFRPRAQATRADAAAQLARAYAFVVDGPLGTAPDAFADDDGHPQEVWIDAAAALGLVNGTSDTTFGPDGSLRRDQMASLLTRLLDRLAAAGRLAPRAPTYRATVRALPDPLRAAMTGVTWQPGCPVPLDDLRLVDVVHRGLGGPDRVGLLVVHRDVAAGVADAFGALYEAGFPIARMELAHRYRGDDARSMAANNSSAFHCRRVTAGSAWSQHSYGRALDLNPHQNPYVRGGRVLPAAGRSWLDRGDVRPGMIVRGGPVVEAFARLGWGWGGDWRGFKDYQHLSASGR